MANLACLWRPSTVGVLTLISALIAAPLPALAGESGTPPPPTSTIGASVQTVAATESLLTRQPALAQETQSGRADLGSPSFFRTPAGIITLVAVGVGVGFALYSTSHDRVKSPAK